MKFYSTEYGTCPVCNGTGRKPVGPNDPWSYGYDKETNTVACTNCGGQTMSLTPTGKVRLRPDGTPCTHEYKGRSAGNCYTTYDCLLCGDSYSIDSGD